MFRESSTNTMPDMFSNIFEHLDPARQKRLNDKREWHNLFYQHITSQIDEQPYAKLYTDKMGAPNAPIRLLVAMMILKEGFGWSDEFLYERTDFDLVIMQALGLNNISDEVPCMATYYNFKKAVYEYQIKQGENLIGTTFEQLTRQQAKLFGVNGKFARMDSKLIGSNIAKCSRLQLVLSVIGVFYKDLVGHDKTQRIEAEDLKRLEAWSKKSPGQIVYGLDNAEKVQLLEDLGYILMRLQVQHSEEDSEKYPLIVRILSEQYSIEGARVKLRDTKEISSGSLQSPYDEDAAYRNKKDQQVQGYSVNITETCNPEGLNLITDVKVEKANCADNDFLQGAVERSQEIAGNIEHVNADGAYHSQENQEFVKKNETNLILGGIQGREGNYEFNITSDDAVEVINKKTGETHQAERNKDDGYKIRESGKLRYFTAAVLASYLLRKEIERIPQSERNRRNNVEATIFQLSYCCRNAKTRYRNLIAHEYWSYSRCLWLNFKRIQKHVTHTMGEVCPDGSKTPNKQEILTKTEELLTKTARYVQSGIEILVSLVEKLLRGKEILTPVPISVW